MIYLQLFLNFFKIGLFTFGGGYAMIPLIRETSLSMNWLTEEQILNFIAVSESTPGPIAVNMATFVGSSQAGFLGSALATLGVILPSFIIILLIVTVFKNFLKLKGVMAFLDGIKPAVVGMILATAITMMLSSFFAIKSTASTFDFDWKALVIFALIASFAFIYKLIRKKSLSPILLIIASGILGFVFYGLI